MSDIPASTASPGNTSKVSEHFDQEIPHLYASSLLPQSSSFSNKLPTLKLDDILQSGPSNQHTKSPNPTLFLSPETVVPLPKAAPRKANGNTGQRKKSPNSNGKHPKRIT